MSSNVRPGRWWYSLSILLLLVGIASVVFVWAWMISDLVRPSPQVVVPGKGEVVLPKPGTYVICYEHRSVVDGRAFSTPSEMPGLRCRVVCKATGIEAPLTSSGGYSYEHGGRSGRAVWKFDAPQAGAYELSAWYPEAVTGPAEIVLTVSTGFPWRPFVAVFVGSGLGLLCILGAVIAFIVTLVRRRATPRPSNQPPPIPSSPNASGRGL